MISVAAAKSIIAENTLILPVVKASLENALLGRLAEDILSPIDVPSFMQSSMDGYAFSYAGWQSPQPLQLHGEMQAGTTIKFALRHGQAARIFTGAPLPDGTDTVVMQEKVSVTGRELVIHDEGLQKGSNSRLPGSAIKAGELALAKDSLLSPGAIGFLAGMGISHVPVFARPAIGIIVTGNELQQPGIALSYGEVYESNSFALKTALKQYQVESIKVYTAADEPEKVTSVLTTALAENDMVLLTGGVSVGDYDFVVRSAATCGISQLFHKIKQKPGKPLYFGRKDYKLVFGLPGNPSSVLTCFYEYVLPALKTNLPVYRVPLAAAIKKPAGLTHFLKGWFDGKSVSVLDAQESYRMSSFARANCLVALAEETTAWKEGEIVEIHSLV